MLRFLSLQRMPLIARMGLGLMALTLAAAADGVDWERGAVWITLPPDAPEAIATWDPIPLACFSVETCEAVWHQTQIVSIRRGETLGMRFGDLKGFEVAIDARRILAERIEHESGEVRLAVSLFGPQGLIAASESVPPSPPPRAELAQAEGNGWSQPAQASRASAEKTTP